MRDDELAQCRDGADEDDDDMDRHAIEDEEEDVLYELHRFDALLLTLERHVPPTLAVQWREAVDATRRRVERQSVQVLAVLHDKDARIAALQAELSLSLSRQTSATRPCGVQTVAPSTAESAVQTTSAQVKVDAAVQCHNEPITTSSPVDAAVQTVKEADAAVGAMETELLRVKRQLEELQRQHDALQSSLQPRGHNEDDDKDEEWLRGMEQRLSSALCAMETSTSLYSCTASLVSAVLGTTDEEQAPLDCLSLEHELHVLTLERDELLRELLETRDVLLRSRRTVSKREEEATPSSRDLVPGSRHVSETPLCMRTLKHVLSLLRQVRQRHASASSVQRSARSLTRSITAALEKTSRPTVERMSRVIAEVTRQWIGWEAAHLSEIERLRQRFAATRELDLARIARLKDELERVTAQSTTTTTTTTTTTLTASLGDCMVTQERLAGANRRVLELQYALVCKDEQLGVMSKALRALAATTPLPSPSPSTESQLSFRQPNATSAEDSSWRSGWAVSDVYDQFASEKERLQLHSLAVKRQRSMERLQSQNERLERANRRLETRVRTLEGAVAMRQTPPTHACGDWTESVLRSRVRTLETELSTMRGRLVAVDVHDGSTVVDGDVHRRLSSLLQRLEAHHCSARDALAQASVVHTGAEAERVSRRLYDALLVQYEDLVAQLSTLPSLIDLSGGVQPRPRAQPEASHRMMAAATRRWLHASTQTATETRACANGETQTEPFRWCDQQPLDASALAVKVAATTTTVDAQVMTEPLGDSSTTSETQRALEASLARLEALTSQNEQLRRQLAHVHKVDATVAEKPRALSDEHEHLERQLAIREQENLELVRQLCDLKTKCFELEQRLRDTTVTSDAQRQRELAAYMADVTTRLSTIENAKAAALRENELLRAQLQRLQDSEEQRRRAQRDSSTATELSGSLTCLDSTHAELAPRLVLLQRELEAARARSDGLEEKMEDERQRHRLELQRMATTNEHERTSERTRVDEIDRAWTELQRELEQLVAEREAATQAADGRIAFLLQCVEECGRLVDTDGSVSTRDLYDTVVSLSQRPQAVHTRARSRDNRSTRPKHRNTDGEGAEDAVLGRLDASTWQLRATRLQDQLSAACWRAETLEDRLRTEQRDTASLKAELAARLTKENDLLSKQGALKAELSQLRAQHSTLASRLQETRRELAQRDEAAQNTDSSCARLKAALQRKTELVTRHKARVDELQRALETASQRVAQLERSEKAGITAQAKHKELSIALQDARQQTSSLLEEQQVLVTKLAAQREQLEAAQRRVKTLRQETTLLREQLKSAREMVVPSSTGSALKTTAASDSVDQATVATLQEEVKTLKRRVLRKQEVIVACKAKLVALEDELASERSRLLAATQTTRQLSAVHREREQSIRQGTRDLKHALDAEVQTRTQQLDGLRASVFDACEVFVRCGVAPDPTGDSDASSVLTAIDDDDERDDDEFHESDGIWLELRQYASLSTADVDGLRVGRSRAKQRTRPPSKEPKDRRERGLRVLQELEHALETSPEDCRAEICQVLEFLCTGSSQAPSIRVARGS
ncbi:hypothetical protein PINS_up000924 [Pythium insidiosum]|nr:hypothetical protein PINS_up000924 [Pythium insidiosum]